MSTTGAGGRLLALLVLATLAACGGGGGGGGGGAAAPSSAWRSALFPEGWTAATTDQEGRFLHDFSFAGYRNGEAPLPDGTAGPVFDIVAGHGADPTGAVDATAAIQGAIDAASAAGGGIVALPAGTYRVDGTLLVQSSGVALAGSGAETTRVWFTLHQGMQDRSHLTFRGALAYGSEFPLAADGGSRERAVLVADASGLAVGDDVAVGFTITDDFEAEHGMQGVWLPFHGTWQPFFRREVTDVDTSASPHRVTLDVPLRYPAKVRDGASLRVVTGHLSEVGVRDLALSNAGPWDDAWQEDRVHVLELKGVKDGWIGNVRSFSSADAPATGDGAGSHLQSGGVIVRYCKRITIAGCRMEEAEHRGGGGNGYLFEVRQSSEILTRDCLGRRGRHNFIQNWGFGVSGCVWLRCESRDGEALNEVFGLLLPIVGHSEFHHSLATANLVDSTVLEDGWSAVNRGGQSSGAGHTATENVFWNTTGSGRLRSGQFGWGYVIGTGPRLTVEAPDGDWVEGAGKAADLRPGSLYEAQFRLRTGREPE